MGEFTGLEISMKDSKRFKDEPGYWGYFSFGHKYPLKAEVSQNAVAACNQCHQDNAKTDWVFSQYYPGLRAAAPTILLMTHRLRAAQGADRIVVLDEGRVVETGTHAALLAAAGLYARMWRMQRLEEEIARA